MAFNANVIVTNPKCHDGSGILLANPNITRGTIYLWSTGHTSKSISAVHGLKYSVKIQSPQGDVIAIDNISINQPPLLESNVESSINSLSVISNGGSGAINITWHDSTTSSYHRKNLKADTKYTYTLTDSFGCTLTNSIKTEKLSLLTKYFITDSFFKDIDFNKIEKSNTNTVWLNSKSIQDIKEGDLVYSNNTKIRKTINGLNLYYAISDLSNELSSISTLINENGEIESLKIY
jgi:pSer/pThr/pTyr-binding forkhead associated (FHA) protein